MTSVVPPMKWAQRKNSVFITITIPEVKDIKVDVSASALTFSGNANKTEYAVTLNFYKDITPDTSKWAATDRYVQFHLMKDSDEEWPQLLKDKTQYKNLLTIDWDRWADSDDEDADGNPAGNFQLPPNFQEMMSQYNANAPEHDHDCGCGCDCGHDHCECGCDSSESESESDSDSVPELEKDN